ncbi:AMMECR1 domain-containing protein [Clostridium sp. 2-1]|uniref:AmmeMemoRadiSam system protein A n=1 Tax=Candidatus Clostridium helianthi TaxID=3381660 RepID=A0ABW8S0U7_9CLOT|nr:MULTISPECIES: AmmeMemoRadiSam system protein A [Clostridium]MBN7572566.1 AmmeMemoRadiSam system protein A [Clostridium beijerinckii]MBN7577509.1 AmmeMemoRadiSam system protein A [Clostridium beijerinckii]MBN7582339.1 AmmeMemoRadiSam system protein A [Clostridium beijerinckii]MBO0518685.1 AmmeMemoRadiSam system protein A [Clostridium beijerinckii]POO93036.1 AMMECR1 domain-containing protein [Clostridium sp. 2-1]
MESILGYYLMPHPPIIIPDIGKGEEKKIEETSLACNKIGREVADIKPDTIIIITPHATMFSDAISISDEERISGDLSQFRCTNIKMDIPIDKEFNVKLGTACHVEGIPSVLADSELLRRYNVNYELDHGSIVPLYFINKYYNDYKLVHITYSMIGDINLYKFGMEIKNVAEKLNRKAVIIASGDLSHKLKDEGPYSYSPYGELFDKALLGNLEKGDVLGAFNMNKTMISEAGQCGLNSVYILLGAMEGKEIKGQLLSYQGTFGVGYGVMKLSRQQQDRDYLDELTKYKEEQLKTKLNESNAYVKLARENLNHYFSHGKSIEDISNLPKELLNERHGVFVSLKKFGNLRGCIGTIAPTTGSVGEEIIRNSIEAAMSDPRFSEVSEDEMDDIDISVDVLMDSEPCNKEDLDPKKYGVIVSLGMRRGLLLPDLEGVNTVDEQLQIACDKADIDFDEDYKIERFEVVRYKEG